MAEQSTTVDPTPHEKFNATDADVVIISSDNVLFRIHSKNLTFASGSAVPDMTNAPASEECHWDDPSDVLETFFTFIYFDSPHPDLKDSSIEKVLAVGRLAHKWGVPHAATICKIQVLATQEKLLLQTPTTPKELLSTFDYLAQYHDKELGRALDEAAMHTLHFPIVTAKKSLSYNFQSWAFFRLQWMDACLLWAKPFATSLELQEKSQFIWANTTESREMTNSERSLVMPVPRFSNTLRNEF
ncbi:hypothetical protein DL96DRAFT_1719117 [Flagelloscypha sp. PMI_526]|nr:hypothetical protein DL96DRAFT_1719117 [Flagelloscypha sp. PMI_526]